MKHSFIPHSSTLKLGKKAPKFSPKTLCFRDYIRKGPFPNIRAFAWGGALPKNGWGMMLNDNEGDCTIAGIGHQIMAWTVNTTGSPVVIPDAAVQAAYIAVTGEEGGAYNPTTGANDNGCAETDVLNYFQTNGIGGHKIAAWLSINPADKEGQLLAGQIFGGLYIGVQMPLMAQTQLDANQLWTPPPKGQPLTGNWAPSSWGGHCTYIEAANTTGCVWNVTWGGIQGATWGWMFSYCDEIHALVSDDWIRQNSGLSPSNFDMAQLLKDAQELNNAA